MKTLSFLLLALPTAALTVTTLQNCNTDCTCPPPTCPQQEPAGCECRNKAILDCSDEKQAAGFECPVPTLELCSTSIIPFGLSPLQQNPKVYPPPAVKPNPSFRCPCGVMYCVQSYPESCECGNRHMKECFENCGGIEPTYDDRCGFDGGEPPLNINPEPTPNGWRIPTPNTGCDPYLESPGPVIRPEGQQPPIDNGGDLGGFYEGQT